MNGIAQRIRTLMDTLDITPAQLARMANVDPSTLSYIFNSKRNPSARVLLRLADAFDVSVDYLTGRTNSFKPQQILLNKLIKKCEKLRPSDQQMIIALADRLSSESRG